MKENENKENEKWDESSRAAAWTLCLGIALMFFLLWITYTAGGGSDTPRQLSESERTPLQISGEQCILSSYSPTGQDAAACEKFANLSEEADKGEKK